MIIASDIHTRKGEQPLFRAIEKDLMEDEHKILILAGDLTHRAKAEEYAFVSAWLCMLMDSGINVVLSVGNHDMSESILITRIPKKKGYKRYSYLIDKIAEQSIAVDRRDEFDLIYAVGIDVFYAPRTTHSKLHKPTRIKKKQYSWATEVLSKNGFSAKNGYRLHLVTHQSLWKLEDDKHGHINQRKRSVKNLLRPFGFSTAINGHNHRFTASKRDLKKMGFYLYHIQAPTLSNRTKGGKFEPGYVKWNPAVSNSAVFVRL